MAHLFGKTIQVEGSIGRFGQGTAVIDTAGITECTHFYCSADGKRFRNSTEIRKVSGDGKGRGKMWRCLQRNRHGRVITKDDKRRRTCGATGRANPPLRGGGGATPTANFPIAVIDRRMVVSTRDETTIIPSRSSARDANIPLLFII